LGETRETLDNFLEITALTQVFEKAIPKFKNGLSSPPLLSHMNIIKDIQFIEISIKVKIHYHFSHKDPSSPSPSVSAWIARLQKIG